MPASSSNTPSLIKSKKKGFSFLLNNKYLTSAYDPIKETEKKIEKTEIKQNATLIIIGFIPFYHLLHFLKNKQKFYFIEPNENIKHSINYYLDFFFKQKTINEQEKKEITKCHISKESLLKKINNIEDIKKIQFINFYHSSKAEQLKDFLQKHFIRLT